MGEFIPGASATRLRKSGDGAGTRGEWDQSERLEGSGLITRVRDSKDERHVRARLTAAGKRLRDDAEKIPDACRTHPA